MSWRLTARARAVIQAERQAGGTQQELATWIGVHPVRLSRWIHGRRIDPCPGPGDQRIRRLATVLGLPVAETVEECLENRQ